MLGLKRRVTPQKFFHFTEDEKRSIIEDYLQSGLTKKEIWKKYTGRNGEHGSILRWMYEYGYYSDSNKKNVTFVHKNSPVKKEDKVSDFEYLQLQKRVSELEKQLYESEMKGIAYQTMIELAEREFKIDIKKKFNTKPSKK